MAKALKEKGIFLRNPFVKNGQSVLEYAMLVAIVSAAFIAMAMYVRRAVQGKLYKIEEQVIGRQNQTRRIP